MYTAGPYSTVHRGGKKAKPDGVKCRTVALLSWQTVTCGSSSAAEHHLAKVDVTGSIPVYRSKATRMLPEAAVAGER